MGAGASKRYKVTDEGADKNSVRSARNGPSAEKSGRSGRHSTNSGGGNSVRKMALMNHARQENLYMSQEVVSTIFLEKSVRVPGEPLGAPPNGSGTVPSSSSQLNDSHKAVEETAHPVQISVMGNKKPGMFNAFNLTIALGDGGVADSTEVRHFVILSLFCETMCATLMSSLRRCPTTSWARRSST